MLGPGGCSIPAAWGALCSQNGTEGRVIAYRWTRRYVIRYRKIRQAEFVVYSWIKEMA